MITERAVLGMFYERLMQDTAASWIDAICTPIIDSDQDSEEYAWLGMVPQLTEKKGEKKFSQLRETDWIVDNVEYQGGIVLPKKHILYDKTGQVRVRVNEMADRARAQWYSLIAPLIVNGPAALCYDGQYFFRYRSCRGRFGHTVERYFRGYFTSADRRPWFRHLAVRRRDGPLHHEGRRADNQFQG